MVLFVSRAEMKRKTRQINDVCIISLVLTWREKKHGLHGFKIAKKVIPCSKLFIVSKLTSQCVDNTSSYPGQLHFVGKRRENVAAARDGKRKSHNSMRTALDQRQTPSDTVNSSRQIEELVLAELALLLE